MVCLRLTKIFNQGPIMEEDEYNADWIGDGLQYQDPEGTFEGIEDTDEMEIYKSPIK